MSEPDFDAPVMQCDDCAFTEGTAANQSAHTRALAEMCVAGLTPFHCHKRDGLCAGWVHAVNQSNEAGAYEDKQMVQMFHAAADIFGRCIDAAVEAQKAGK